MSIFTVTSLFTRLAESKHVLSIRVFDECRRGSVKLLDFIQIDTEYSAPLKSPTIWTDLIICEKEDDRLSDDTSFHQELANIISPFVLTVYSRYFNLRTDSFLFDLCYIHAMHT